MFDWWCGKSVLFGDELYLLLLWLLVMACPLLDCSTLVLLLVVDNLANVSIAFASFGSAGGSCTMLTVLSLQIVILWLSIVF